MNFEERELVNMLMQLAPLYQLSSINAGRAQYMGLSIEDEITELNLSVIKTLRKMAITLVVKFGKNIDGKKCYNNKSVKIVEVADRLYKVNVSDIEFEAYDRWTVD